MTIIVNDIFGNPVVFPYSSLSRITVDHIDYDTRLFYAVMQDGSGCDVERVYGVRVHFVGEDNWVHVLRVVDYALACDIVDDFAQRLVEAESSGSICDLRIAQQKWADEVPDRIVGSIVHRKQSGRF